MHLNIFSLKVFCGLKNKLCKKKKKPLTPRKIGLEKIGNNWKILSAELMYVDLI